MNQSIDLRSVCLGAITATAFFVFPEFATAEDSIKWENSLWSSSASCNDDKATFLGIESNGTSYKIALCGSGGCRIAVPGFGKKIQDGSYMKDPRLTWHSSTMFNLDLNGVSTRFHRCK